MAATHSLLVHACAVATALGIVCLAGSVPVHGVAAVQAALPAGDRPEGRVLAAPIPFPAVQLAAEPRSSNLPAPGPAPAGAASRTPSEREAMPGSLAGSPNAVSVETVPGAPSPSRGPPTA